MLSPRPISPDRPCTIGELFRRSVERTPDAEAVATVETRLTYAELDARAMAMARALVAAGVGKGGRVALLAPDGPFWLTTFLAATRIGALVVAVSTLATAPELAHILKHSDSQFLIGVRGFLRHDYSERLEAALPSIADHRDGALYLKDAPYLRRIWLDDAEGLSWASGHADLLALPAPAEALIEAMAAEVAPSDDAVIIYTSGSSALPKAVVHTQRSAAEHSQVLAPYFRIKPTDRVMPLLPMFWVGGLNFALEILATGGTLVYPLGPGMEDVADAHEQLGVNRINSWGPQSDRVRAAIAARGFDPDTVGGLAVPRSPDGVPIPANRTVNMLGMTESFGPHSAEPSGELLPENLWGSSGRVTSDFDRRIVDPDTGEVLATGQLGELQLRRGGLMRGFYKMDADRVFTPDGFYPTGDSAYLDEAGHLFFKGRLGDMLKTGGANVSRQEVEAALRSLPEVALPIVVGLPDPSAGQIVAAAVVAKEGFTPTEESLKIALRDLVANYKIPKHIVLLDEGDVPWTPSNKVKVGEVAAMIAERTGHGGER
ncbi:class I adenylate-forming enzyme family protein [Sphingomonas bacterium]|uniref:class I adenylate-forming enzyme family protein n=1 Tax=Sphingomonas bacterium TaxID=1895847 RepID=UPI0015769F33|nr:class I adenylate-forming enzyme family protein [Sphingomonas bacterium]